jgi:uncharacterized iron-regulated membrane protein
MCSGLRASRESRRLLGIVSLTWVVAVAATGAMNTLAAPPFDLWRALELSRPLHFGNYGGMPLKIIWALLDIVTIIVLGSGLYLWLGRRRSSFEAMVGERHIDGLALQADSPRRSGRKQ